MQDRIIGEGITFDEDFFFHPSRRVEVERKMERALHERWGRFGLGEDHDKDLPVIGAVHLAAGYIISEMLGCRVDYLEDSPPQVIPANLDSLELSADAAFEGPAYRRLEGLVDAVVVEGPVFCRFQRAPLYSLGAVPRCFLWGRGL